MIKLLMSNDKKLIEMAKLIEPNYTKHQEVESMKKLARKKKTIEILHSIAFSMYQKEEYSVSNN